MVSLSTARAKGRDAKRKADLVQLQKALALYETSNNNYPSTGNAWYGLAANGAAGFKSLSGPTGWIPNLAPTYVTQLPQDPRQQTTAWSGYLYRSDGTSFKLLAHAEGPESFPIAGEPFYDPVRPTWAWMVCAGTSEACSTW